MTARKSESVISLGCVGVLVLRPFKGAQNQSQVQFLQCTLNVI